VFKTKPLKAINKGMKNSVSHENTGSGGGGGYPHGPDYFEQAASTGNLTRLRDVLKESHKQQQQMQTARRLNHSRHQSNYQRRLNQNSSYQTLLSQIECSLNENLDTINLISNSATGGSSNDTAAAEMKKINRISFIELLKLIDTTESSEASLASNESASSSVDFTAFSTNSTSSSRNLTNNSQMIIQKIENDLKESMSILCQYNNGIDDEFASSNSNNNTNKSSSVCINDYTIVEEENESDDAVAVEETISSSSSTTEAGHNRPASGNEARLLATAASVAVENRLFSSSNFNRNDLTRKNVYTAVAKTTNDQPCHHMNQSAAAKRRNSLDQTAIQPLTATSQLKNSATAQQFNYDPRFSDVVSNASFIRSDKCLLTSNDEDDSLAAADSSVLTGSNNDPLLLLQQEQSSQDNSNQQQQSSSSSVTENSLLDSNWNYDELNELRKKFISLLSADGSTTSASNHYLNSTLGGEPQHQFNNSINSKMPLIVDEEQSNKRFSLDQNTVNFYPSYFS
jgi:hypothetical protein